jgi:pimeloyl-ACP methyl ester carboxylesterase
LADRLELSRAAVVGYSLGGAAAVEVRRRETRCAPVVDLDGDLLGRIVSADPPPARAPAPTA